MTLTDQNYPPHLFEIIVVDDRPTESCERMVAGFGGRVRYIRGDERGPASARNLGVEAAAGEILLFLDDDVAPTRGLLNQHARIHAEAAAEGETVGCVGLTPFGVAIRRTAIVRYKESRYGRLVERSRPVAEDLPPVLFTVSNASVPRAEVVGAGLFNEDLAALEDVELALRLKARGVKFRFWAPALAYHNYAIRERDYCAAQTARGRAAAQILAIHPGLSVDLQVNEALGRIVKDDGFSTRLTKIARRWLVFNPLTIWVLKVILRLTPPAWRFRAYDLIGLYHYGLGLRCKTGELSEAPKGSRRERGRRQGDWASLAAAPGCALVSDSGGADRWTTMGKAAAQAGAGAEAEAGVAAREEEVAPRESEPSPRCHLCGDERTKRLPYGGCVWLGELRCLVKCRACSVMFLDPYPSEGEAWRLIRERRQLAPRTAVTRAARLLRSIPSKGGRLLDVACGSGYLLTKARSEGFDVVGLEVNPALAGQGRRELGLDIRDGRLEDAGFAPASFDVVYAGEVLGCFSDPKRELRRMALVLAIDGILVAGGGMSENRTLANAVRRAYRRLRGWPLPPEAPPARVFEYTPKSLAKLLEDCGFSVEILRVSETAGRRSEALRGGAGLGGKARDAFRRAGGVVSIALSKIARPLGLGNEYLVVARKKAGQGKDIETATG